MSNPEAPRGYTLEARVGLGGMGCVYQAVQTSLGRRVAIKFLDRRAGVGEDDIERFRREARAASTLNHRNIVTVHEYGENANELYMVMELVEGFDLQWVLNQALRLPPEIVLLVVQDVAAGLALAHEHKIIHRDIKPGNLLVARSGDVKIADFGVARFQRADGEDVRRLTMAGQTVGTPPYMSPEQLRAWELDARTDVYSLGVVAYELLSGKLPFDQNAPEDLHEAILGGPAPPLGLGSDPAAHAIEKMVARAMARSRDVRTPSAREILREAGACLEGLDPEGVLAKHRASVMERFAADVGGVLRTLADKPLASRMRWYAGQDAPAPRPATVPRAAAPVSEVRGPRTRWRRKRGGAVALVFAGIAALVLVTEFRPHDTPSSGPALRSARRAQAVTTIPRMTRADVGPGPLDLPHPEEHPSPPAIAPAQTAADPPAITRPRRGTGKAYVDASCSPAGDWYLNGDRIATAQTQELLEVTADAPVSVSVVHPLLFGSHTWNGRVAPGDTVRLGNYAVATGTLRVATLPPDPVAVWIEGRETGEESPLRCDVATGRHLVNVTRAGWTVAEVTILDRTDGTSEKILPQDPAAFPGVSVSVVKGHDHKVIFHLVPAP